MKLSELVKCLSQLDQIDLGIEYGTIIDKSQSIKHIIASHTLPIGNLINNFDFMIQSMSTSFVDIQKIVDDIKNDIRRQIAELEPNYYQNSQSLYDGEKRHYTTEYLLNRQLEIDPATRELLQARILTQADWKVAGMIIHPGQEKFIEHLIALDPLYLVDQHQDLLAPAMQLFSDVYQRRLRPYVVNDYEHNDVLWQLPNNQFGFIFAYNYFNYTPMKVLRCYLDSIYTKLRPGGTVLFTINDCDFAYGIALAEANAMCYTPGKEIKAHAESLGFEIVSNDRGHLKVAWMELKKPGKIQSIRGGQSLAKIVAHQ